MNQAFNELGQVGWGIADGLVFMPNGDPETCITILICHSFGTPRGLIWMETQRTLDLQRILYAPGVISVHGSFSLGESRTRVLRSETEHSIYWTTVVQYLMNKYSIRNCETDVLQNKLPITVKTFVHRTNTLNLSLKRQNPSFNT